MGEISNIVAKTAENSHLLKLGMLSEIFWVLTPVADIEIKKKYWPLLHPGISKRLARAKWIIKKSESK